MTDIKNWVKVPLPLTDEMEVAFAEAWYSKRRCIDDVEMSDAWAAACNAAPEPPQDPRTESLQRQVGRLNDVVRNTGKARDKLQMANDELVSLLRESFVRDKAGFYSVAMTPSYRERVRQALQKYEFRRPGVPTLCEETADHFQEALEAERPGSEQIRGVLNDTIARAEAERDAALAQLQALQNEPVSVKLIVVHRGNEVDEPQVTFSPEFARQFDALPAGTEVCLYTSQPSPRFRGEGLAQLAFPTMLRQMWSGSDVQGWLNEQGPVYAWPSLQRASFQSRVAPWLVECFGDAIAQDTQERNQRFLEEALELVQACALTSDEAHQLVDYVFGRDVGEQSQEVGGVMVTLAALCRAHKLAMHQCGETELDRISRPDVMARIREKQKGKPAFSPLPGVYPDRR
ncbi:hypothetical protein PVE_R2G0553 [Pseudomonas veronii 1YdBTEX2]|uniref:Uncharacterized protein n=1 Tax=Pseudomonas veronii 1YdBTEX2 TaxID=1295141 RepID=A0A1D3K889_PSEVE|nr:hypothetical protein [Pseudomonas sp. AP19]SBW84579.1 hypothetical protein PVE_R2G0553 [Pseudomonas veronii 1YdBTEX2]